MAQIPTNPDNLSGQLLAAHPALRDPNFRRRVVLIVSHSPEEGALGVIVNWSMEQTLANFDSSFSYEPLGKAPLYRGGPVAPEQITLAAWSWKRDEGIFRLGFGIEPEQATDLLEGGDCEVRAFLGCAGWGQGQLEEEMAEQSWMVAPVDTYLLGGARGSDLWRQIVGNVSPEMRLLADAPEDPTMN